MASDTRSTGPAPEVCLPGAQGRQGQNRDSRCRGQALATLEPRAEGAACSHALQAAKLETPRDRGVGPAASGW